MRISDWSSDVCSSDLQLAGIAQEMTSPQGLAARALPPLVFGATSPYAKQQGAGDPAAVAKLTRDDLIAFQQAWLRPDKATIFVVSSDPLATVKAALDQRFRSEENTSELKSLMRNSYAVLCLKKQ